MKAWNLKNKVALVTGGSKGIGKATVREFLSLGANVLFTGRNKSDLDETYHELIADGYSPDRIAGDVADKQLHDEIYYHILKTWGKLDILVNNAGLNIRRNAVDYTEDEISKVLNTDLMAPFALCRRLVQFMKSADNASIINVSSIAGSYNMQTGTPYGMAKAGLIQMTRALAGEWAPLGVRVNAVSPGFTETPLTKGMLEKPEVKNKFLARTPLGRVGADHDIAAMIAFLAMDKAAFITGQNFIVDGGLTSGLL
jgi:Tropinone reductase 1